MDGAIAVIGLCSMEVVPKSLAGSAHGFACAVAQGTCTNYSMKITMQGFLMLVKLQPFPKISLGYKGNKARPN